MSTAKELGERIKAWVSPFQKMPSATSWQDICGLVDELVSLAPATHKGAWMPIETAPRDGTQLLLVDDEGIRVVGRWGKHNHVPLYGWIRQVELYGEEVDGFDAVAWQPLPEPPGIPKESEHG